MTFFQIQSIEAVSRRVSSSAPPHLLSSTKVQPRKEGKAQVYGILSLTDTQDDVDMMKEIGMDAFRLSISWPRLLPNGKLSGGVNKEGIRFYNSLIDELLSNGIQPFVTLFHWDLPQALEDDYGGFLSSKIIEDFRDYSELCFKEFGDRVKHWITFNEPSIFSNQGYSLGRYAPGRCSRWVNSKCSAGNSATEPYVVGHNQLLAHAATVKLYKEEYQAAQKGKIGITLVCHWMVPFSNEKRNVAAAQRAIDFTYGWFMDPLAHGDYPKSMRSLVGTRLPRFTIKQSALVKGSFDFLGLNYYTGFYAADAAPSNTIVNVSYNTDYHVNTFTQRNETPIGPKTAVSWLSVYPRGIHDLLIYTKTRYKNPVIYITENGIPEPNNITLIMEEALKDDVRINYHSRHFQFLLRAIKEGVDVRGYFAWSLFDHFDWALGYTLRYGIGYVDYKDRLERYPKRSAIWFKSFLKSYNKM
ncbi:PREDICTED: beta-glucosidase 12-like isoform X2 [Nelumbo nucifera]|uniref:Beta-glucosidase 12-like isoform X2 n=1 Tax=Nelumbo nucifera TaxID=4432 RepID=A0A1U8AHE9_NELNU|nr:PREDICTED: beta-glucosidase 12-like isoform X2 [Nelumbo nucifera]